MKKIAIPLLVLAAVIVGALYRLSGNVDGLVESAIETYGSAMTQAKVSIGAVKIAPADGKGTISNLFIGNPAGFKTAHALKGARIDVDVDLASLAKDAIVIRRIAVIAPDVIYEKGDAMTNFDAIQNNISAYLGPSGDNKNGKRLIVDQFNIRDVKAQASAAFMNGKSLAVPVPDITLKNLGRTKGGITAGELGQKVVGALQPKLTHAVNFDRLMNSGKQALGKVGSAIKGLFK